MHSDGASFFGNLPGWTALVALVVHTSPSGGMLPWLAGRWAGYSQREQQCAPTVFIPLSLVLPEE